MNFVPDILDTWRHAGNTLTWSDDAGECSLDAVMRNAAAFAPAVMRAAPEPGGMVALLLENDRRFDAALLACWLAGRVPVPLNPRTPPEALAALCAHAGVRCMIAANETRITALATAAMEEASSPAPVVLHIEFPVEAHSSPPARAIAWPALERAIASRAPGDPAIVLFTSGTEGPNKGVILTHDNLRRHAATVAQARYYSPGDAVLSPLPRFHCYAILMCAVIPLLTGASVFMRRRFAPKSLLRLIAARRLTHLFIVPSMTPLLARAAAAGGARDLTSVKLALSGGGSLGADDRAVFERATGLALINGYGLTEATSTVASNRLEDNRPGSAGPPVPGVEIAVWDEAGRPLPTGAEGEIVVRGPNIMKGYHGDPEATRRAITPEGWLRTGDSGRLDNDNYLTITGRLKDIIISAGLNIHPREIEEVLHTHPAVAQAAVAGQPDRARGEAPHAWIVARDSLQISEREILAFCAARLAPHLIPRSITILESLPVNALGKVQKHLLKH